jgi:hypothetical protein
VEIERFIGVHPLNLGLPKIEGIPRKVAILKNLSGAYRIGLSKVQVLDIQKPGWYPLMIKYFQRVGASAIAMYWKLPEKTNFSVIPAEAYFI